jgi:hypothetical protein
MQRRHRVGRGELERCGAVLADHEVESPVSTDGQRGGSAGRDGLGPCLDGVESAQELTRPATAPRAFAVGDRVYGGALGRAVADIVLVRPPADSPWRTPEGISDEVASTLPVAGLTAAAALAAIGLRPGDTVLMGGACRPDATSTAKSWSHCDRT